MKYLLGITAFVGAYILGMMVCVSYGWSTWLALGAGFVVGMMVVTKIK